MKVIIQRARNTQTPNHAFSPYMFYSYATTYTSLQMFREACDKNYNVVTLI